MSEVKHGVVALLSNKFNINLTHPVEFVSFLHGVYKGGYNPAVTLGFKEVTYMIFTVGLVLIIAGWITQVYKTWGKRERNLSPVFLSLYGVGCILLLSGNFLANDITTGILNTICVILAAILLTAIVTRKKTS